MMLTRKYSVFIALLVASAAAVSTHIIFGFPFGHSAEFNIYWQQFFTEQLFAGEVYPRWLFNYLDGLGAPVFYFYAPLPFYLFSVIAAAIGKMGGEFTVLTVSHMTMFLLSGIAFYIFISRFMDKYWAIAASVLYIYAPYHYIDLEVRAAVGESFAYVWIPLIMAGLYHPNKSWARLLFSGFCYAGLILSHLPSALLAAPVIAIFSIAASNRDRWLPAIGSALFIGITGVALSAFYSLPAILLQDTLPYDAWVTGSGPHYQAVNWLIGNPDGYPYFGKVVYSALGKTTLLGVAAVMLFGAVCRMTKYAKPAQTHWRLISACLLTLAMSWLLMTNLSRPIWELAVISQIQFPWRLGVLIDFCSVVLFALAAPHVLRYLFSLIAIKSRHRVTIEYTIAITVLAAVAIMVIARYFPTTIDSIANVSQRNHVEYRPKWVVESSVYLSGENVDDLVNMDLAYKIHKAGLPVWKSYVDALPSIAPLRDLERNESMSIDTSKAVTISIDGTLNAPATIRIRKVYYPHWRLTDTQGNELTTYPDPQTGLLLFDLPPGIQALTLDRRLLSSEKAGALISIVAIIASLLLLAACGRRKSI